MSRPRSSEPVHFTTRDEAGATVIEFQVDNLLGLDDLNRIGLKLLALAAEAKSQKLVLDLSHIRYAGSAALGLLLKLDAAVKERGAKMVLVVSDSIEGLLRVSRTRNLFTIATDVAAAIKTP